MPMRMNAVWNFTVAQGAVTVLAAMCLFGHSTAAHSAYGPIHCPAWDLHYATPERAIAVFLEATTGIPAACKPIVGVACNPRFDGPKTYICLGVSSNPAACGTAPVGKDIGGSGKPEVGNIVTVGTFNGKQHCAVNSPDAQNRGDPNCPGGGCGGKGNPVNIAAPNKYQKEVDFGGTAEGMLAFERHYNSAQPVSEEQIGVGWTHTWRRYLYIAGDRVRAHRPDGKLFNFFPSGSAWLPPADVPYQLVSLGANGWQLTSRDDEVETYSAAGRLVSVTTRQGRATTFVHSDGTASGPNGAVYDGTSTILPIGFLIRAIDDTGRTLEIRYAISTSIARITDPAGGNYIYGYNASGDLVSVQYPNGAARTYHYNESANTSGANLPHVLTGITDENGNRFATYKYMTDRRPLSTEHAGGVYKHQFTYGGSSTTYVDPLGTSRTATHSTIMGVNVVTGTTQNCVGCGGTATESQTFDANRNRASFKDFKGNLTCYSNNARNLETARTEGLSGAGTCSSRITTLATRTISTEWHPTWRIPKRIAEPLRITTFNYHGESGVSCAPSGAATTLVCSKVVQATTDNDGTLAFTATPDGAARTWSYTYNAQDKVLTADGPRSDVSDLTTYGYSAGTHRLQSLSGAQTQAYTVDAAGNMTSDGTTTWVYGGNNRPISAGGLAIDINALGQRVRKQAGAANTVFVYDEAGRLWGEYTDAGALIQETIWLDELPVATLRPNGAGVDIFYIHADHLGTPRAITRPADNQFVWKWDNTEPFGNSAPDENPGGLGTFNFNLRFPGQYYDGETGKHYNYFRDYDPAIGRYIESDPIGLAAGLNTYAYVGGNPLLFSDPRGEIAGTLGGCAAGAWAGPLGCGVGAALGTAGTLGLAGLLGSLIGSDSQMESRSIPNPARPKCGCTCICRADANDNIPGNIKPGKPAFAFGEASADSCAAASKEAKRIAIHNLGAQPKHVGCRCRES